MKAIKSGWLVLVGGLLLLGLMAGPAQAEGPFVLRILLAVAGTNNYVRVDAGQVDITNDGVAQPPVGINNITSIPITRSGLTDLTFWSGYFEPIHFYFIWTSPTDYTFYDENWVEVPLIQNSDGTYYLDYVRGALRFFPPVSPWSAPLLGEITDQYGTNTWPQVWGWGMRYERMFSYGEPDGQHLQLVITWTYPDGSDRIRTYGLPYYGLDEDGIMCEAFPGDGNQTVYGDIPYRLTRRFYVPSMFAIPSGQHTQRYVLQNSDGDLSNSRVEHITIERWEDDRRPVPASGPGQKKPPVLPQIIRPPNNASCRSGINPRPVLEIHPGLKIFSDKRSRPGRG